MKLIRINETLLINPEMISTLEIRKVEDEIDMLVVTMSDGKEYVANIPMMEIMKDLMSNGLEQNDNCLQFWAG